MSLDYQAIETVVNADEFAQLLKECIVILMRKAQLI